MYVYKQNQVFKHLLKLLRSTSPGSTISSQWICMTKACTFQTIPTILCELIRKHSCEWWVFVVQPFKSEWKTLKFKGSFVHKQWQTSIQSHEGKQHISWVAMIMFQKQLQLVLMNGFVIMLASRCEAVHSQEVKTRKNFIFGVLARNANKDAKQSIASDQQPNRNSPRTKQWIQRCFS